MLLNTIIKLTNELLVPEKFHDYAPNGLQVEGTRTFGRRCLRAPRLVLETGRPPHYRRTAQAHFSAFVSRHESGCLSPSAG